MSTFEEISEWKIRGVRLWSTKYKSDLIDGKLAYPMRIEAEVKLVPYIGYYFGMLSPYLAHDHILIRTVKNHSIKIPIEPLKDAEDMARVIKTVMTLAGFSNEKLVKGTVLPTWDDP